ncbi:hypothetical protein NM09_03925 [Vibrio caribbeanicus]|uniref:Uncharacterized protein n=1 Tax=Vibrio caribbeanicus TaxID=701175 RepID=A0ACC4P059_9VIBR|nr:hypothetical protein [Vibrio caribbeanicus]KHD25909.1 hypothetical protein NM09_03925 [Vibrio caribbeanicus]
MRDYLLSCIVLFLLLYLTPVAFWSFSKDLVRNRAEVFIFLLESRAHFDINTKSILSLSNDLSEFPYLSPHDLAVKSNLLEWYTYLTGGSSNSHEVFYVLSSSLEYRPTWSPTYIQLFKLYWRAGNEDKAIEMLRLANMFGPNRTDTMLTSVDYTFTNWLFASQEDRLRASKQLLTISESWKHRSELNQMITYSPGKQRICNMLAFNKVKVSACQ